MGAWGYMQANLIVFLDVTPRGVAGGGGVVQPLQASEPKRR